MNIVENAARWRRGALSLIVIGFIVWRLPDMTIFQRFVSLNEPVSTVIELVGAIIWIGALIALLLRTRADRRDMSKAEFSALEDERVQALNNGAFRVGFWVMLVAAALLSTAGAWDWKISHDAADIIFILGVAVTLLHFVMRDAADE